MKKRMCYLVTCMLILMLSVAAVAEVVAPCADEVFRDASINLTSSGRITYTASTRTVYNKLSVSNCYLQQYVDGVWKTVCTLPNPASMTNTKTYLSYTNSAEYLSTGTYRVVATFSADGYTITRTSNERTY